jgi:predicted metalloprotease with PDZ domain
MVIKSNESNQAHIQQGAWYHSTHGQIDTQGTFLTSAGKGDKRQLIVVVVVPPRSWRV